MNLIKYIRLSFLTLLAFMFVHSVSEAGGKKFSDNIARSLFSDQRAYQVGDVVTILIIEYSMGQHEAGTETESDNQFGVSVAGKGDMAETNMGMDGSWKNRFDGTGGTTRKGVLEGTLSARIIEITDSGNLVIEGERVITVNGEKQISTMRGIVRPEDISGQNTVYSNRIADAESTYTGKGDINSAQKPGFFTKIINWIF